MRISRGIAVTIAGVIAAGVVAVGILPSSPAQAAPATRKVQVPESDKFLPMAMTIHVGDTVLWTNHDTDDHTVVSDDAFTTAGNTGTNLILVGTDNNGGQAGTLQLTFSQSGTFLYYCRFHARLDKDNQPVAPGPDGGIERNGNFGTPMMGVLTVLP
ncbi:MAG: Copper binding protein plastocyanin/azurin family [Acidimicrobiaceae bacterium]|jgi:plastocyanin|nr:Copper binding protein plastocyanin/azurin family [Acidimicrobiaceae bacterium]